MESLHTGPYCIKTQILHHRRQMGLHRNNQPVVAISGKTNFLESEEHIVNCEKFGICRYLSRG